MKSISSISRLSQSLVWLFTVTTLLAASPAQAHFIWVYRDHDDQGKIKIVFGEELEPDEAEFLAGLPGMKVFADANSNRQAVEAPQKADGEQGWFEVTAGESQHAVDIACKYGVFKGSAAIMFLDYNAKFIDNANPKNTGPAKELTLDLVPQLKDGEMQFQTFFQGAPAADVEFQYMPSTGKTVVQKTDAKGRVSLKGVAPKAGERFVFLAKKVVAEPGEHQGNAFEETRYYCTLVWDIPKPSSDTKGENANNVKADASFTIEKIDWVLPEFPRGMTSFGAAVTDGQIYVLGGKSGKGHQYAKAYQNRNLYRLNPNQKVSAEWESVDKVLGLQGLAMVSHNGKLIAIGGLEARNNEGDEQDLHSVATVSKFDPATNKWKELPELPHARSSLDATVDGDTLIVVGGWTMDGEKETEWRSEFLTMDLSSANLSWKSHKIPFHTRAMALKAFDGKWFAIGGIQEKGGPSNAVHVYDPETKTWSVGPALPAEGGMKAFGSAAEVIDGHLLVSTYDGGIYSLSADHQSWDKVYQADLGRFFHRMMPLGNSRFAIIGGANMEVGRPQEIDVYQVLQPAKKVSQK